MAEALRPSDQLLIVLDTEATVDSEALYEDLCRGNVQVVLHGRNLGLSPSRNIAVGRCETDYIVFVDDDVIVTRRVIESMRRELEAGYEIVGVRLCAPPGLNITSRWFMSAGQLHYLAIHASKVTSTWGGCMGLSVSFLRRYGIRFREELGRKGDCLWSGDDTTLLNEMKGLGASEKFLSDVHIIHNIDQKRVTLSYMLRRAYWQGRSELRRSNVLGGLRKEWRRNLDPETPAKKKLPLGLLYVMAVCLGVLKEHFDSERIKTLMVKLFSRVFDCS
jgi:glycosyltransferase involved in cell wall biosynthesis